MYEILVANWWTKGDSQLEWWNHGDSSNIMTSSNDHMYSSALKYKPSDVHTAVNYLGNSSLYANNFGTKTDSL